MRDLIVASQLAKQMGVQVDPNYRWKMAAVNGGEAVRPSDMRTGHLFNVVKMILPSIRCLCCRKCTVICMLVKSRSLYHNL